MKKQNVLFLILISTLALGACDKLGVGTSKLVGTWDITSVKVESYTNGSLDTDTTMNNLGSFTFNKAGDGSYSLQNADQSASGTFDWFEKNEKVFINGVILRDTVMTKNLAIGFDVITNTSTEQVWSAEYSNYSDTYNETSGTYVKSLLRNYFEISLKKK